MRLPCLLLLWLFIAVPAARSDTAPEPGWARLLAEAPEQLGAALQGFVEAQPMRGRAAAVAQVRRWLEARVQRGEGSSLVPALLAQSWRLHGRLEDGLPWLVYARVVTLTERSGCVDTAASEARVRWLRRDFQDFDALFRALPGPERGQMVAEAVALEAVTWPQRRQRPSAWLCTRAVRLRQVAHAPGPLFLPLEEREVGRDHDFMGLRRAVQQMAGTEPVQPR